MIESARFLKISLAAVMFFLFFCPGRCATLFLKNGTVIKGAVTDSDARSLSITSPDGGMTVNRDEIASMETDGYAVSLKNGSVIKGSMKDVSEKGIRLDTGAGEVMIDKGDIVSVSTEPVKTVFAAPPEVSSGIASGAAVTPEKPEEAAKAKRSVRRHFSVSAGLWRTPLELDLRDAGGSEKTPLGGAEIAYGISYLQDVSYGLQIGFDASLMSLSSRDNNFAAASVKTSGELGLIEGIARYNLDSADLFTAYIIGGAGISLTHVSYVAGPVPRSRSISTTQPAVSIGAGIERPLKDTILGIELRWIRTVQKDVALAKSPSGFLNIMAKLAWGF